MIQNRTTLESYELGVNAYIEGTPGETTGSIKEWIDYFLTLVSLNARIIEIGSAHGRDALYIESRGYLVERTDATSGFVNLLKGKGHSAREFNILTDDFNSKYDAIFANAVFLHFTPDELKGVLKKVHLSLTENGILAFSLKCGEGEEWTNEKVGNPRYFCYWKKGTIQTLLETHNFEIVQISEDEKWLKITAKRKQ